MHLTPLFLGIAHRLPRGNAIRSLASLAVCILGSAVGAQTLPPEVESALARAKVPREALAAIVVDAAPALASRANPAQPLLNWRAASAMNPASVMKLVTTYAALDILGPAFSWKTPVYTEGAVQGGMLTGNLYIKEIGRAHV